MMLSVYIIYIYIYTYIHIYIYIYIYVTMQIYTPSGPQGTIGLTLIFIVSFLMKLDSHCDINEF